MCISDVVKFLLDYPIEDQPYPDHYPDDLIFEHYPGKDYVVGFCDEAIDDFYKARLKQKDPAMRELILGYVDVFKRIRDRRLKLLGKSGS